MTLLLREAQPADIRFLREMLYEAVFWRAGASGPSFEEGLADPEVSKSLAGWGERAGDTGVVAMVDSVPAGAAWYRYWTDDNFIYGYVDPSTPVLVIAVRRAYRRRGIGGQMMAWLVDRASRQAISRLSLSVSKDNHALELYRQQGFLEQADKGDAWVMVRDLRP
ncbi:MAG: GNAT family N-acetyltransferase [Chloroflexota bacterium]|jgi:ribosomal protein S18 acetylase RimI-like enzyme